MLFAYVTWIEFLIQWHIYKVNTPDYVAGYLWLMNELWMMFLLLKFIYDMILNDGTYSLYQCSMAQTTQHILNEYRQAGKTNDRWQLINTAR